MQISGTEGPNQSDFQLHVLTYIGLFSLHYRVLPKPVSNGLSHDLFLCSVV